MWQDTAFSAIGLVFSYSLIPTIIVQTKSKQVSTAWQTIILTILCMSVALTCYFTMGMYFAFITNLLCVSAWAIIAIQKFSFEKDK